MVTRGAVLSVIWVRAAPWTRDLAYSSAFRYPVDSVAIALVPTIMRACSMTSNICAMPLCTSPTSQPLAGTSCCPSESSQVADTLRPILCSTFVTYTPLRSPSSPVSKSNRNLGTKNSDSPLVPGPAPSGRASTRWKMFSNRSPESPEVMNRLTPSMCQEPSSCSTALVRPAPTSEPASGSVSTMVEPQPRSAAMTAHFFCSSVPRWCRIWEKPAPPAYIHTAGLAPSRCSCSAHSSALGNGVPPRASSIPTLSHPASWTARTDFWNDSGNVTECVAGSKTGGLRSPSTNEAATGPSASRLISFSISWAVSASTSPYSPWPNAWSTPNTSNRLNTWSRTLLL